MDPWILLSELNDFLFCPRSIYLHHLYGRMESSLYQCDDQVLGTASHTSIDEKRYSSRKDVIQGLSVASQEHQILGKIDLYDQRTKTLIERKRTIKVLHHGYKLQLYGQYICMSEMGYEIEHLALHSLTDNKRYHLDPPSDRELDHFYRTIRRMRSYDIHSPVDTPERKCQRCIYRTLCDHPN